MTMPNKMIGTQPFPGSEKLIAGSPHIAVPCCTCGERIYVAVSRMRDDYLYREQCSDCVPSYKRKRRAPDKAEATDIRYNG